ncbi:MAG: choice-of-anchor B family protein [Flavobacteriales bacterium]|nr:choice-of-anchor B family protein [Flavobacteriales bacterium]
MKQIFTLFSLFSSLLVFSQTPCEGGMAGEYPCQNIDLMAFLPLSEIGGGSNTNDVWGWVGPSGTHYAIVGCSNGTAFLDLSDPTNPIYLGMLPTYTISSLWRDVESRGNYLFVGSEAPAHGLQVFDLMDLEDVTNPPITFEAAAHYDGFGNSHTIAIDQQTGFLYANGTNTFNGGLHIVDINDPLNPELAGGFESEGYTHDSFAFVYNGPDADYTGKEIVMACNGYGPLVAVDVTDKTDCQTISTINNDEQGYIHQGWFTEDQRYFLMDDEMDEGFFEVGIRTHIFDYADLDQPEYMGFFEFDINAIDHNLYIKDNKAYESNYTSGVRVLDVSNVAQGELEEIAYFDLYPEGDLVEYEGTWSNYPFFDNGLILATDMYDGIYILHYDGAVSVENQQTQSLQALHIMPNPASTSISFECAGAQQAVVSDLTGRIWMTVKLPQGGQRHSMEVKSLPAGMYVLDLGEGRRERFVVE